MPLSFEDYVKRLAGRGQRTIEMVQGQIHHQEATRDIPTIDEYGVDRFREDLRQGKPITLKELRCDSHTRLGLRGTLDQFTIQKIGEQNHYFIQVTEAKTSFFKTYLRQLTHYGLIVSAPDFAIAYRKQLKTKGIIASFRVYPTNSVLDVDLILRVGFGENKPKYYLHPFMRMNNLPSDPQEAYWVNAQIAWHERAANGWVRKRRIGTKIMKTRVLGLRHAHMYGSYALNAWELDDSNPIGKTKVVQSRFGTNKLLAQAKTYNVIFRRVRIAEKTEEAKPHTSTQQGVEKYLENVKDE